MISVVAAVLFVTPLHSTGLDVRLMDLAAVRRQFNAVARQQMSQGEGERIAGWADVCLLADAVVGRAGVEPCVFEDLAADAATGQGPHVPAEPGVGTRDAAAYQLLALGYSARETADI